MKFSKGSWPPINILRTSELVSWYSVRPIPEQQMLWEVEARVLRGNPVTLES